MARRQKLEVRGQKLEVRKNLCLLFSIFYFLFSIFYFLSPVFAEDPYEIVTKKEKGLRFSLPPDWPIEERNNLVAPIPVEEYLAKRFFKMDKRFEALEQQLQVLEKRLSELESAEKRKGSTLQSDETLPPAWETEAGEWTR